MIEFLIIFLLSFPPLLWFRDGFVLLGHDSGFRLDYLSQLPNLFYSWNPIFNFGADWSIFKGFLITQFPEVALSWLTHSFALGEKIALIFWFAVMGAGMLFFLRAVFPDRKYRFFRLFTSIFYMYNYFILDAWGIGERAKFSLYAALPIGLLLMYNVLVRNKPMLKNGIYFGLLYFFLNGGGVLPLYGGTMIVLGSAFIYYSWGKHLFYKIKTLIAFIGPLLFLNAYYIIPNIFLLHTNYGSSVGAQGGIEGLIAWERVVSSHASFLNVLRLQGVPTLYDNPWRPFAHILLTNKLFIAASFIPIVTVILGFLFCRPKNRLIRFLVYILPIGLIFTMGTHPPTGILYEFAMKKIPGFVMFRSSFYKFAPAFWFPMIVLTGYFINEFGLRLVRSGKGRIIAGIVLIFGLLIYHYPFFTTDTFALSDGYSTRVRVPEYLSAITGNLKSRVGDEDAVLVMPKMKEFSPSLPADMYTWHFFSLNIFPRNSTQRRFIANDSDDPIVGRLYDALYAGNSEIFLRLAGMLHVNYVLWRGDAIPSPEESKTAKNILDADPHIQIVLTSGPWILYRIVNSQLENKISAVNTFSGYDGSDTGGAYLVETYGTIISPGDDFIEAECVMCKENEYKSLVASIGAPATRIRPGSPLFIFEQWREHTLLDSVRNKPKERIDADIALAQRYLSWGDHDRYSGYMKDAVYVWATLSDRDRIMYAIRLKAFLDSQKEPIPPELEKNIWISEPGIYRYIGRPPEGYQILVSDPHAIVTDRASGSGLHFIEVHASRMAFVYFKKTAINTSEALVNVTFRKINPTKYKAHITNPSADSFLLILREEFDPRWVISIPGGEHVKADGFANGWILQRKGTYDVTFSYSPQQYFYIGLAVSAVAFILCAAALIYAKKT